MIGTSINETTKPQWVKKVTFFEVFGAIFRSKLSAQCIFKLWKAKPEIAIAFDTTNVDAYLVT